jgi:hypothetical protein
VNNSKSIIIVVLNQYPVAYRRQVNAGFDGVGEVACQLGENFAPFIPYETAVLMDCRHTGHRTVRPSRFLQPVLKPLIEPERSQLHRGILHQIHRVNVDDHPALPAELFFNRSASFDGKCSDPFPVL